MNYRIGIDLGTNSLGWAAVLLKNESGDSRPGPLLDMGVRIFSDARNPKDKSSNAAQRRGPRAMRRNRDRRIMRRESMLRELTAAGLFPANVSDRKTLEGVDPWILRARALDERLEPHEIGRALFHLQQRRGFKSNRKTDGEEDGAMFDAIERINAKLGQGGTARTLGELKGRLRLEQESRNVVADLPSAPMPQARVKATLTGSKMAYDYYPSRAIILEEFEAMGRPCLSIWRRDWPKRIFLSSCADRIRVQHLSSGRLAVTTRKVISLRPKRRSAGLRRNASGKLSSKPRFLRRPKCWMQKEWSVPICARLQGGSAPGIRIIRKPLLPAVTGRV